MDNNEIKKYIVKITYKNYGGSGVIVPLSSSTDYFYIFTAKHTFFDEKLVLKDINFEDIEDEINIKSPNIGDIIVRKKDILSDIKKEYDFLIFCIPIKSNPKIRKLKSISIFLNDFKDCTVMGYPKVREDKDTKYDSFDCTYKQENHKLYIFEMNSDRLLTTHRDKALNPKDTMAGISGSGVFVQNIFKQLCLVGIQIQSAPHNSLIAIDLRYLIKDINEALEKKNREPIKVFSISKFIKIGAFILLVLLSIFGGYYSYNKYSSQINLKGRVIENDETNTSIPNVKVYLKDNENKFSDTNQNGNFNIDDVDKRKQIILCYEHKDYQEDYCLPYKREGENNVRLPK